MKKRYKLGDPGEKVYNDWYCDLQVRSAILNSSNQSILTYSTFWNKSNINSEILARVGGEEGWYKERGDVKIALIPFCRLKLTEVKTKFQEYQQKQVNRGYEKPTEFPKELLDMKMEFEAKFDIYTAEVEKLEKALEQLKNVVEVVDDSHVLEYGLICSGSFHGIGTNWYDPERARAYLDGQFLTMVPEGFLIIDDKRSLYDQMKVSDYHKLAKQWTKDREEKAKAKFKLLQQSCKEKCIPIPNTPPVAGGKKINKASLPAWPDWATKYSPEVPEPAESNRKKLQRTK